MRTFPHLLEDQNLGIIRNKPVIIAFVVSSHHTVLSQTLHRTKRDVYFVE